MPVSQLDNTLAALADPTRRAILAQLAVGERTVTELAEPFEMTMPAVTKHLKVLEKAGLIRLGSGKIPASFRSQARSPHPEGRALQALLDERAESR